MKGRFFTSEGKSRTLATLAKDEIVAVDGNECFYEGTTSNEMAYRFRKVEDGTVFEAGVYITGSDGRKGIKTTPMIIDHGPFFVKTPEGMKVNSWYLP